MSNVVASKGITVVYGIHQLHMHGNGEPRRLIISVLLHFQAMASYFPRSIS